MKLEAAAEADLPTDRGCSTQVEHASVSAVDVAGPRVDDGAE